jgi:hypothetical protein
LLHLHRILLTWALWLRAAPKFSHFFIATGLPKLGLKTEEGICQVLAHMWLQKQLQACTGSSPMPTVNFADAAAFQFQTSGGGTTKKKVRGY